MSRATPDDQLKFLLNCVKHSNNGKIDFIEVAKECGIVSKGAAAKRYERLMKANGIHPNGGPSPVPSTSPLPPAKPRSKAEIAKEAAAKKRKIEGTPAGRVKQDEEADDKIKPKMESVFQRGAQVVFKAEPPSNPCMPLAATSYALSSNPTGILEAPPLPSGSAKSIFEEFCTPEMFAHHSFEEAAIKVEQQPQLQVQLPPPPQPPPPQQPQQPRYMPPPPPALVERIRQSSNVESRKGSGKGPLESIVIAD